MWELGAEGVPDQYWQVMLFSARAVLCAITEVAG